MPHDPSRMTIFATAMTSGMLLALAALVVSGRLGISLTSVWRDLFPTDANAVRSALGWWMIAGAGFLGSFLAGLLVQDLGGRNRRRGLRRLTVALFFILLAGVPYLAAAAPAPNLPFALGANLAGFALGTLTAFCGSWFALPRPHDRA
jgi:MFS-type transporter involved in bile tolerance (Atg22 family)